MRRFLARAFPPALALAVTASLTLMLGLALAQDDPAAKDKEKDQPAAKEKEKPGAKEKAGAKGKRRGPVAAGAPPKKNRPNAADPLGKNRKGAAKGAANGNANPANAANPDAKAAAAGPNAPLREPTWPFYFKLKISGGDDASLAANYYPPRNRFNAPVVMLLHDRGPGRSGKDWQEPIEDLKGMTFAESLQNDGYAVLVPDLRGHGANPRHALTPTEWRALPADLQAMYLFLVDRHNRGDFNLGKFGVVAVGESANLAATWAALPGAAVSSEGRVGDLSALVLLSPIEDADGLKLVPALGPIAPRIPILLACGDRDNPSLKVVKEAQPIVERHQRSKVSYLDTGLHGEKLVRFYPKALSAVTKYLDDPLKARVLEWEPRFLLTPVAYQSEGTTELTAAKKSAEATKKAGEPAKKKDAD